MGGFLGRAADRRIARPPALVYWLADRPPWAMTLGLALQVLAVQSAIFVVPVTAAMMLGGDPSEATRFLGLSILIGAAWQLAQGLTRGPLGSGYPVPSNFTAVSLAAYAIAGEQGVSFGGMGAAVLLAGLAAMALTFALRRLRALLPDEVAGVVILLIGVALVTVGVQELGLAQGVEPPRWEAVALTLGCMGLMAGIGFAPRRVAVFAVLLGALAGVPVAFALGLGPPGAGRLLAAQPWLAWPQPWMPEFRAVSPAAFGALLVALLPMKATTLGCLVMMQRAVDARWTRPDAPPLRRGLLANGLAIALAGLVGGAPPGPSTAAAGLSIATGTLARRVVRMGAGLLVLLALCPKALALFVLVPQPVKAAMLFTVAGFIMAQGCQVLTTRLLDTRRQLVVAFGLVAGIAEVAAPGAFLASMPMLSSPVAFGAAVAFIVNLVTLPLVRGTERLVLPLDAEAGQRAAAWVAGLGGGWGLKPQTVRAADQAIGEVLDLLAARGTPEVALTARLSEARIEILLDWTGAPLPAPMTRPDPAALLGDQAEREAFAVWLAARQAQDFRRGTGPAGPQLRLGFDD